MRIAYLTTDLVNLSLARELGEGCGETVQWIFFKEKDRLDDWDAVLYDLDFLLPVERSQVLALLTAGQGRKPAAVHSYSLEDDVAEALRVRGVAVQRRLDVNLFRQLCQTVRLAVMEPARAETEPENAVPSVVSAEAVPGWH